MFVFHSVLYNTEMLLVTWLVMTSEASVTSSVIHTAFCLFFFLPAANTLHSLCHSLLNFNGKF